MLHCAGHHQRLTMHRETWGFLAAKFPFPFYSITHWQSAKRALQEDENTVRVLVPWMRKHLAAQRELLLKHWGQITHIWGLQEQKSAGSVALLQTCGVEASQIWTFHSKITIITLRQKQHCILISGIFFRPEGFDYEPGRPNANIHHAPPIHKSHIKNSHYSKIRVLWMLLL